jgi:MED6 mediator sub complex component
MSETASFVDPVFLARFGLSRINVLDYFLHPLNPFRTNAVTVNEHLAQQGTGIGLLMAHGVSGREGPLSPLEAEAEYNKLLTKHVGEQYELLPPEQPVMVVGGDPSQQQKPLTKQQLYAHPSPLYVIRHLQRTSVTSTKILGMYYVVEGVIYKSPAARSVMKTNIARCANSGLAAACRALASCARYAPANGYCWIFEKDDPNPENGEDEDDDDEDPMRLWLLARKKRRKVYHRPGERTAAEEEGIRASEAMDQILVRLTQSQWVKPPPPPPSTKSSSLKNVKG